MSQSLESAGELQTDKQGEPVDVSASSVQCYFHPETEQLVFLTGKHATDFETHSNKMMEYADNFHAAQKVYDALTKAYAEKFEQSAEEFSGEKELREEVSKAEDQLEEKRAELREALGKFSQDKMGYDDVTELLPVKKGKDGKRYSYVRRGYFEDAAENHKLHRVSPTGRDKSQGGGSIYTTDKNGSKRVDTDKLKTKLTTLDVKKISLELKDVLGWVGAEDMLEDLQKDVSLFDWAESWNEKLVGARQLTENLDVSGGAQVMRYVQNVGASAEYDPDKGNLAAKVEAKSSFTLVSGMCKVNWYVPDHVGWSMSFTTEKGNVFDLGMLRLVIAPTLTSFIGATAVVEGQLQVVRKGEQQLLAGQPGSRLPRFSERRDKGAVFHRQREAEDEGVGANVQLFAGVKVEGELKGTLQWLKPADPPSVNAGSAQSSKSSGKYTDFCSLATSVGGLAGVGAGGEFHCTFINGKFCFHVAASLCWGVGSGGGLTFEVGTAAIAEFGGWLVYQLFKRNYGFFEVISKDAFEAYTKYGVMKIGGEDLYEEMGAKIRDMKDVARRFNEFVELILDESPSQRRNRLASNVIRNKDFLLLVTPESKGILLYLLTRHGIWDDLDLENYSAELLPDRFYQRKEAVICVLHSIQTRREWQKVLSRVSRDGCVVGKDENVSSIVEKKEQDLVEFLQLGFDRDADLQREKERLFEVFDCLKEDVSFGYALAMNNTVYYRLNIGVNPFYPQCRTVDFNAGG